MSINAFTIMDRDAQEEIPRRRLRLRIPYDAHDALTRSLAELHGRVAERYWTLPPTAFPDEVRHFTNQQNTHGLRGPQPTLRPALSRNDTHELSIKIDVGLKFLELGENADPYVKPILLYYSCAQLCGLYSRVFFNWTGKRGHGLECGHQGNPTDVGKTVVTSKNYGTFPRLETALFLLTGWPSCFSELVTYSTKPTAHSGPGEYLENFCKEEICTPIPKLSLEDIYRFDYGTQLRAVRLRHGFHKFNGLTSTAFLLDVIVLYMASSLARYDVLGWREILDGRNNPYRKVFEEAFERYRSFTVDAILAAIEDPSKTLQTPLIPSQPSPYCHMNRRFKRNPNQA
jgi:hypothetical protein